MAKFPSSTGKVPKGKGGSNRTLDHPACGKAGNPGDHKTMPMTSHAGGKPHPGIGSGKDQKYASPKVKTYAQGPGKFSGGF